jgi:hypothetical protein
MDDSEELASTLAASGITQDSVALSISEIVSLLEASEYILIQTMVANGIWTGAVPLNPGGSGDVEWGLIPYWISHPPAFVETFLNSGTPREQAIKKLLWDGLEALVPSHIDPANYQALIKAVEGAGIIMDDGSFLSDHTYAVLDPQWLWAVLNWGVSTVGHVRQPFATTPPVPIRLDDKGAGSVTIALVGDWGTGPFTDGQAIAVMAQIAALNPNYLVHMGDVYFAGTAGAFLPPNEEQENFIDCISGRFATGTCFALNSNHEMYGGAEGYYTVALADGRFRAQNKNSYFALTYGGWTILGLDSAYYATGMYMNGSLDPQGGQAAWIGTLGLTPSRTIVLTHHNPILYNGAYEASIPLWSQVTGALGSGKPSGDPAAWYWGHIHNGIVYNPSGITGLTTTTRARCLGHGALPFGDATGLKNISTDDIPYYACTPNPRNPPTVLNGFVLLTIDATGTVTERFFEQGNTTPKYSSSYSMSS